MKTFTHTLDVEGRQARFLFSPVITNEVTKYFITVAGLQEGIVNFEMEEARPATWKVLHPAPQWIRMMEAELSGLLNSKNYRAVPEILHPLAKSKTLN